MVCAPDADHPMIAPVCFLFIPVRIDLIQDTLGLCICLVSRQFRHSSNFRFYKHSWLLRGPSVKVRYNHMDSELFRVLQNTPRNIMRFGVARKLLKGSLS